MAYDNNSNPSGILWAPTKTISDWAERPGTSLRETPYTSLTLDANVSDQDQIVVVRTFDISSVTPAPATPFTGEQVWKLWTLPNSDSSGSPMYQLTDDKTVVMSATAADYKITIDGTEYTTPTFDYATHDTYVLRRTYSKEGFVTWTAGSRITSAQLNHSMQQVINLLQEGIIRDLNRGKFDPFIGQANGVASLDSDGKIPNSLIGASTLGINTELGVQGTGTTDDKLRIKLNGGSLTATSDGLSATLVNDLTTGGTTVALTAEQGKLLKAEVDTLGTGITYKGSGDINAASTYDTIYGGTPTSHPPSRGDTVVHTGSGTSADTDWVGLTSGGSIAQYNTIRWNGSAWTVVAASSYITTDGNTDLHTNQKAVTQAAGVGNESGGNEKKVATCEHVYDEITASSLERLSDVTDSLSKSANDVLRWTGSAWANSADYLRNVAGAVNIKLENLANVPSSPTNDQVIKYSSSGSEWVMAALDTTSTVVGVTSSTDANFAGTAGTDVSGIVQDAWITSTLGHTGSPTANTLKVLEFNGAKHLLGDNGATFGLPAAANRLYTTHRQDVTYRNGHLQWKGIDNDGTTWANNTETSIYPYMIAPTDTTGSAAGAESAGVYLQDIAGTVDADNAGGFKTNVKITAACRPGETVLTLTETDDFFEGDVIRIVKVDATHTEYIREDSSGGDNRMWFTMTNRIKKVLNATQIELETPVPSHMTANKFRIYKNIYHVTNANQNPNVGSQPSRLSFENMKFENLCSGYYELPTNPLSFVDTGHGSFEANLGVAAHNFPANKEVLASFDSISLQGDLGSTFYWGDINRMTKDTTAVGTYGPGKLVQKNVGTGISLGAGELGGTLDNLGGSVPNVGGGGTGVGNKGGSYGVLGIGYERGIRINDGQDIVFKNCTFDGWAEAVILEGCYNVRFEDCTFNSPLWTGTGPNSTGIKLIGCTNVTVKDCTFNGCHYGIKNIDTALTCYDIAIKNCKFHNICSAVYFTGCTKNIRIQDCDMVSRAWNVRRLACSRGVDNSSYVIHVEGWDIKVTGCTMDGSQNYLHGGTATETWDPNKYGLSATSGGFDVSGGFDGGNFSSSNANQKVSISKGCKFVITGKGMEPGNGEYRSGFIQDLVFSNNSCTSWEHGILVECMGGYISRRCPINGISITDNYFIFNRYGCLISYGFDACNGVFDTDIVNNTFRTDYTYVTNIPRGISTQRDKFHYRAGETVNGGYGYGTSHDTTHYGNNMDYLGSIFGIRTGALKDPYSGADPPTTLRMNKVRVKDNYIDFIAKYGAQQSTFHPWGMSFGTGHEEYGGTRHINIANNEQRGGYALHTVSTDAENVKPIMLKCLYTDNVLRNGTYGGTYSMHRYGKYDYTGHNKRRDDFSMET